MDDVLQAVKSTGRGERGGVAEVVEDGRSYPVSGNFIFYV